MTVVSFTVGGNRVAIFTSNKKGETKVKTLELKLKVSCITLFSF